MVHYMLQSSPTGTEANMRVAFADGGLVRFATPSTLRFYDRLVAFGAWQVSPLALRTSGPP